MKKPTPSYQRHRFPSEIISHAVWLYHRFCLSFREVEELLAKRGISVTYETVRQWCQKFGPAYARKLKKQQGRIGDTSNFYGRLCTFVGLDPNSQDCFPGSACSTGPYCPGEHLFFAGVSG